MRKKLGIIFIIFIISFLNGCVKNENGQDVFSGKELVLEDIQDKIIRFHVLANSDTEEDQALKLKVRDRVIDAMSSKFSECNDVDDARDVMLNSIDEVSAIAKEVIGENGYNYTVTCEISRENFPDKMYGDVLFPQGEYEAFRILIGEAKGQNWWCVMFPPLCFVDESRQAVNTKETKENLDNGIEKNNEDTRIKKESRKKVERNSTEEEKIEFKLKIFEIFKEK